VQDAEALVLSVVSHGQRDLLLLLLADLGRYVKTPFRLIVTENLPEKPALAVEDYLFPIEIIRNTRPKGFGANHNAALARAGDGIFVVLNPDIRLDSDPFPKLCAIIGEPAVGVVAPAVTDPGLHHEDHARSFPSIFTLVAKLFGYRPITPPPVGQPIYYPDWVAGMFMTFRAEVIRSVGGFDERYFLYYEDVDLCARLRDKGLEAAVCGEVTVVHSARRQSRKSLRFASWHFMSAVRFFASRLGVALGLRSRNPPEHRS